jgi:hypothetical protein
MGVDHLLAEIGEAAEERVLALFLQGEAGLRVHGRSPRAI